ncbi:hypothetical protein PG995_003042 [Apiospora arundinis]
MSDRNTSLACPRCSQTFSKKSSLTRHSRRCLRGVEPPSRKRSCLECSSTKVRCDMRRPSCGRCQARSLVCEFPAIGQDSQVPSSSQAAMAQDRLANAAQTSEDQGRLLSLVPHLEDTPEAHVDSEPTVAGESEVVSTYVTPNASPPHPGRYGPGAAEPYTADDQAGDRVRRNGLPATAMVSEERRRVLLGTAPGTPSNNMVVRHTMHIVIRVLRSWPRLMATYHTAQLPPIIHCSQVENGIIAKPLANCYTLARMWDGHAGGSTQLVQDTILNEVRRIFQECASYNEVDLLAAAQSVLILLIILFYGGSEDKGQELPTKTQAQLITQLWDVKHQLAGTNIFLAEECGRLLPRWQDWAAVSAKRRTILAMHHLEWSWSLRTGYPTLTCFELAPSPAPAAGYLWRETDEARWKTLYGDWLDLWKGGPYLIGEFFNITPEGNLDARSELWLAEVDEFGMMLIAETYAGGNL